MPETLEVAAPSAAEPTLEIPRSNSPEYVEWRKTGELPKNEPRRLWLGLSHGTGPGGRRWGSSRWWGADVHDRSQVYET